MLVQMEFKDPNFLKLRNLHFGMRAEMVAKMLTKSKDLYEVSWDRELWLAKRSIRVVVQGLILGRYIYLIDGTKNEIRILVEALEKHFTLN